MTPLFRLLPLLTVAVFAVAPAFAKAVVDTTPRDELLAQAADDQDMDQDDQDLGLGDNATIDDSDLQAFAQAAVDVHKVRMKWLPQLQQSAKQGSDAELKVEQQAMEEMAAAVERNGLTIGKYNAIVDLAQSDPLIQRRIAQEMQQNGAQLGQAPGDEPNEQMDDPDQPDDQTAPDSGEQATPRNGLNPLQQ